MGNMKKNDQIQEILNKRHKIIICVEEEDHIHNTSYQKKDRLVNQRVMWDDLKKNINHLVNKINSYNFKDITNELLSLNLLWGRGLFCNAVLKSLSASESLLAYVIAVVNTVFPDVGYLLVKRALIRFGNYLENRDEIELISMVKFLGYLISHGVVDKQLGLEMMYKLTQLEIKGNIGLCQEMLLCQEIILKESNLRLSEDHYTTNDSWDFVEVDDQVTHEVSMLHELDEERELNVFRPDTNFATDDDRAN